MKNITLLLFCLSSFVISFSQEKAITENGEEVILFDDGTWSYLNPDEVEKSEIPINPKAFKKDDKSSFLLKSSKFNIGFYINPKVWTFQKAKANPEAEYELMLKDGDLYGMIISEKVEIPLEALKNIAIKTARASAPDLKLVKEEYRTVNGINVLMMQLNGTMQGIKFSYYGYYYSNENGTVQFVTYTSQNLIKGYEKECDKLLNGLIEIK